MTFVLVVIDNLGQRSTNEAKVTVHLNHPPNPVIVATPTPPVPQLTKVTLDASQSKDIDAGDQISYRWTQDVADPIKVALSNPTGSITEFTAPENETSLLFHLNVTDRSLAESVTSESVEVKCSSNTAMISNETTLRSSLAAPICGKLKLTVEVDNPEINPYPSASIVPQTTITIKGTDSNGKPADGVAVELKTCTVRGDISGDGHLHDKRHLLVCDKGNRPIANLKSEFIESNPITVKLSKGVAKVQYFSPKSSNASSSLLHIRNRQYSCNVCR